VLRVLLGFAVDEGMRAYNPALGIKLKKGNTRGFHSWTEDELRQYEERHPIGTKARLALALLLYTALRRADVVRLGPSNLRDGRLRFAYSKNGSEVDIPVAAPLAEVIAKTNMTGIKTFLVTDYGKPFTANGFGNLRPMRRGWPAPVLGARPAQGVPAADGPGGTCGRSGSMWRTRIRR
jgi:integrase